MVSHEPRRSAATAVEGVAEKFTVLQESWTSALTMSHEGWRSAEEVEDGVPWIAEEEGVEGAVPGIAEEEEGVEGGVPRIAEEVVEGVPWIAEEDKVECGVPGIAEGVEGVVPAIAEGVESFVPGIAEEEEGVEGAVLVIAEEEEGAVLGIAEEGIEGVVPGIAEEEGIAAAFLLPVLTLASRIGPCLVTAVLSPVTHSPFKAVGLVQVTAFGSSCTCTLWPDLGTA